MNITINGTDYNVAIENTGNRGADITRAARKLCEGLGIDWKDADVFAQHGDRCRCYTKKPGFITLGAHG
jgi:hypothetical protein